MSLINDALKRAEEERRDGCVSASPGDLLPAQHRKPKNTSRYALAGLVAGAALIGGVLLAYRTWESPKPAGASPVANPSLTTPPKPASRPAPKPPATLKAPTSKPAAVKTPNGPAPLTDAQTGPKTPTTKPTAHETGTPEVPGVSDATSGAKVTPATKTVKTVPPSPAGKLAPAEPAPKASDYKITGIMVGADGPTAIVNGRLVGPGDKVGRATIVKITSANVTFDVAGQEITVGM